MKSSFALPQSRSTIFASEDESVKNCLRKMKKSRSRAILLTSEEGGRELVVGIFSETDLVQKASFLEHPLNWNRPIKAIMRMNLKPLAIERLSQVASFMITQDVRSVPIVHGRGPVYRENVWGMVHAFDIVHAYAAGQERKLDRPSITATVHTLNSRYPTFIADLLKKQFQAKMIPGEIVFKEGQPAKLHLGLDLIFLDMNHFAMERILEILNQVRECPSPPKIVFMLDESQVPRRTLRTLLQLGTNKRFGLLLKPINPLELQLLLQRLRPDDN